LAVIQSERREASKSSPATPGGDELQRILRLEVPVIVKLAERKLMLSEVMRLGTGAIIEFFKSSEEPLQLLINNKPIGVGETVKVGENFGLRITQIGDVKQIIASLGGSEAAGRRR
jgi:flagellar motor switch protein FliN/FliY